jgi:hypothetical protein
MNTCAAARRAQIVSTRAPAVLRRRAGSRSRGLLGRQRLVHQARLVASARSPAAGCARPPSASGVSAQ